MGKTAAFFCFFERVFLWVQIGFVGAHSGKRQQGFFFGTFGGVFWFIFGFCWYKMDGFLESSGGFFGTTPTYTYERLCRELCATVGRPNDFGAMHILKYMMALIATVTQMLFTWIHTSSLYLLDS